MHAPLHGEPYQEGFLKEDLYAKSFDKDDFYTYGNFAFKGDKNYTEEYSIFLEKGIRFLCYKIEYGELVWFDCSDRGIENQDYSWGVKFLDIKEIDS